MLTGLVDGDICVQVDDERARTRTPTKCFARFSLQKQQEDKHRLDKLERLTEKVAEHSAQGPHEAMA